MFRFIARRANILGDGQTETGPRRSVKAADSASDASPRLNGSGAFYEHVIVEAYYSASLLRIRRRGNRFPKPRSALSRHLARWIDERRRSAVPSRTRVRTAIWLSLVAWLVAAGLLWYHQCTDIPTPKGIFSSYAERELRRCNRPLQHCRFPAADQARGTALCNGLKLALILLPVLVLPVALVRHRRLFQLNIHLLHPESPEPHTLPLRSSPRELDLALRMIHPDISPGLLRALPRDGHQVALTPIIGASIAESPDAMLVQQCSRLLRYAFLSRLADDTPIRPALPSSRESSHRDDRPHPSSTASDTIEPPVYISPETRAVQRAEVNLYINYVQIRTYLSLVAGVVGWAFFYGLTAASAAIAVALGFVWLAVSLLLYTRQRRDITAWLEHADPEVTHAPTYELDQQKRQWSYIDPGYFLKRGEPELGTGFEKRLSIAFSVLLVTYLTLLDVLS